MARKSLSVCEIITTYRSAMKMYFSGLIWKTCVTCEVQKGRKWRLEIRTRHVALLHGQITARRHWLDRTVRPAWKSSSRCALDCRDGSTRPRQHPGIKNGNYLDVDARGRLSSTLDKGIEMRAPWPRWWAGLHRWGTSRCSAKPISRTDQRLGKVKRNASAGEVESPNYSKIRS